MPPKAAGLKPKVADLQRAVELHKKDKEDLAEWVKSFTLLSEFITKAIKEADDIVDISRPVNYWITQYVFLRDHYFLAQYGAITRAYQSKAHQKLIFPRKPSQDLDFDGMENLDLTIASNHGLLSAVDELSKKSPKVW